MMMRRMRGTEVGIEGMGGLKRLGTFRRNTIRVMATKTATRTTHPTTCNRTRSLIDQSQNITRKTTDIREGITKGHHSRREARPLFVVGLSTTAPSKVKETRARSARGTMAEVGKMGKTSGTGTNTSPAGGGRPSSRRLERRRKSASVKSASSSSKRYALFSMGSTAT